MTGADDLPVVVAQWTKNSREQVKVSLDRYRGNATVDCRCWYDDNGIGKPSKLGLTLGIRHLPELASAINAALDEARRRGLVGTDTDHEATP